MTITCHRCSRPLGPADTWTEFELCSSCVLDDTTAAAGPIIGAAGQDPADPAAPGTDQAPVTPAQPIQLVD